MQFPVINKVRLFECGVWDLLRREEHGFGSLIFLQRTISVKGGVREFRPGH